MKNEATNRLANELAEGRTWLLDLVAAVDYLRRGIRPGITVWDAPDATIESERRFIAREVAPDSRHST